MQDFEGVIIEESLADRSVLGRVEIVSTDIEPVTPAHQTPWVQQWTMHTVRVAPDVIGSIAQEIAQALDPAHNWYADLKTGTEHYVIYTDKVFHITDRTDKAQYDKATAYGVAIGIPEYQVDFSPHLKHWER